MARTTVPVVYERRQREEHFVERRWPGCKLFWGRTGPGGCWPAWAEIVAGDELGRG